MEVRQNIVVFTGAGISKESGIPTFRDMDGMWKKYDAMKLASAAGFDEDPEAVLEFYNSRRRNLLEVQPNHAHLVLAELEKQHDVTIITQNVDDLHERAGSSRVLHLHGELRKVTSSMNRLDPDCIQDYPLDVPIRIGDKAADGSQMRPYIVWFGEYLNNMEEAVKLVRYADIFVVSNISRPVPYRVLTSYLKCWENYRLNRLTTMAKIEILGSEFAEKLELQFAPSIKAGFPSPADDYLQDRLDFNRDLIRHPETTFYGRVSGDSMMDAGINDGDIAVIDKSIEASDGDIVVGYVNNEFTIKFLDLSHRAEGYIELRPANKNYQPIRIYESDDFEVWGVVVWTIKNWKRLT